MDLFKPAITLGTPSFGAAFHVPEWVFWPGDRDLGPTDRVEWAIQGPTTRAEGTIKTPAGSGYLYRESNPMNRHFGDRRDGSCPHGSEPRGASLVEYVLVLSLIALVTLASVSAFGTGVGENIDDSASRLTTAGG